MSGTIAQMVKKIDSIAEAMPKAAEKSVTVVAQAVTTGVRAEIASVTHGSNKLRNAGKSGAKVGAKYIVKGSANPTALITATGPMQLIERNTKAHNITPKGVGGTRGLRAAAVAAHTGGKGVFAEFKANKRGSHALFFGGRFAAYSHTGGTKGKHPFEHGVNKVEPKTGELFHKTFVANAMKAFS